MQDKVGISFALNRIAIGFYFQHKYELSLKFNMKCLQMIDEENIYSILYNIGIVKRKLKDFQGSLDAFNKAQAWAHARKDIESECLIIGQLALTYHKFEDEQKALHYYMECKRISNKCQNSKLELDCLVKALDIRETMSVKTGKQSLAPTENEYMTALEVRLQS